MTVMARLVAGVLDGPVIGTAWAVDLGLREPRVRCHASSDVVAHCTLSVPPNPLQAIECSLVGRPTCWVTP